MLSDIICRFNAKTFDEKLDLKFRPDEILIDHFSQGCWAQCPFCKATCTNTIENHDGDHSAFHRVTGIVGMHFDGAQNLCTDICSTVVKSKRSFKLSNTWFPFKQYRNAGEVYANWSFTTHSFRWLYWKWFVCKFQKHLEMYYEKSFEGNGRIPKLWRLYSKVNAINSLKYYT